MNPELALHEPAIPRVTHATTADRIIEGQMGEYFLPLTEQVFAKIIMIVHQSCTTPDLCDPRSMMPSCLPFPVHKDGVG